MIKLSYEQQIAFNSLSIIVGNALYALTVVLFLVPSGLITGGATGIALGINRALGLPVSGVLFVINMTMLTVGWVLLGRRFAITTIASTVLSPLFLALWERVFTGFVLTDDLVLNTIFAGLGVGISLGITIRAGASTGGMDIPPLVLNKYFHIPVSASMLVFDMLILCLQAAFSPLQQCLYGIVMVIVFVIIFMRSPRFLRFKLGFYRLGWSKAIFGRLNSLGWPIAFQMGMETASFSLSAVMIGWLGTIALASHQIMCAISQFTFMMFYGMGAAVAVRVSNFNGQEDTVNVRRSAYAGFHLIMAMAVVLGSIVFLFRNYLGGWFTDNEEVSALVAMLIIPMLVYQFGDGLQINFANALRGISDVKPMMLIAFIAYFMISLPVGYFCGFVLDWGTVGVWMAFPFGLTSAGIMLWLRFRYKTK